MVNANIFVSRDEYNRLNVPHVNNNVDLFDHLSQERKEELAFLASSLIAALFDKDGAYIESEFNCILNCDDYIALFAAIKVPVKIEDSNDSAILNLSPLQIFYLIGRDHVASGQQEQSQLSSVLKQRHEDDNLFRKHVDSALSAIDPGLKGGEPVSTAAVIMLCTCTIWLYPAVHHCCGV